MTRDAATRRAWSNHALVRELDTQRKRWGWRVLLVVALTCAPIPIYLVQQNECLSVRYDLNRVLAEREQLVKEEHRLRIERARLESLLEIERWAEERAGLVRPAAENVVVVRKLEPGHGDLLARAPDEEIARAVR